MVRVDRPWKPGSQVQMKYRLEAVRGHHQTGISDPYYIPLYENATIIQKDNATSMIMTQLNIYMYIYIMM